MRDACHRNLYALANSSAMNGIGPDTTIRVKPLSLLVGVVVVAVVMWLVHIFMVYKWVKGKKAWKKTQEYHNYKAFSDRIKEEKKQK